MVTRWRLRGASRSRGGEVAQAPLERLVGGDESVRHGRERREVQMCGGKGEFSGLNRATWPKRLNCPDWTIQSLARSPDSIGEVRRLPAPHHLHLRRSRHGRHALHRRRRAAPAALAQLSASRSGRGPRSAARHHRTSPRPPRQKQRARARYLGAAQEPPRLRRHAAILNLEVLQARRAA